MPPYTRGSLSLFQGGQGESLVPSYTRGIVSLPDLANMIFHALASGDYSEADDAECTQFSCLALLARACTRPLFSST